MKKSCVFFSHFCCYKVYKARKQLAAIDWNFHVNLGAATTKTGGAIVTRKYNHRKKEWNSKVVKVKKKWLHSTANGESSESKERRCTVDVVTRQVSPNESDPALLAPTIAATPAPPKELRNRSFCPKSISPQVVSPQLKVVSPQPKVVSPQLKVVSPQL